MTSIVEKARAEADRVEAELGTENPEPETPGAGTDEPGADGNGSGEEDSGVTAPQEPELDDASAEPGSPTPEQLADFEKQVAKHESALKRIMGADFRYFVPCSLCDGVGHVPGQVPAAGELEHDPSTETCATCKGLGQLTTGSKHPEYATRPCGFCAGSGYVTRAEPALALAVQPTTAPVATNAAPEAPPGYILVPTQ